MAYVGVVCNIPVFDGLSNLLLLKNVSLSNASGESSRRCVLIHHKKWGCCCGGCSAGPSSCGSAVAVIGEEGIQDNDLLFELSTRQPELSRVAPTLCYHFWNIEVSHCSAIAFCPHSVFTYFVWISEQTAIISLYSINWLVFITETECVYCAVRTGTLYIILRSAHTVYLCVLCGSENKQRLFPYTTLTDRFYNWDGVCFLRGTGWVLDGNAGQYYSKVFHFMHSWCQGTPFNCINQI